MTDKRYGRTRTVRQPQEPHAGYGGPAAAGRVTLYRIPEEGRLFGVCTGLADYWGINPIFVQLGWVIVTFMAGWFTVPAYILLAIIMPRRPQQLYRDEQEEVFWQDVKRKPKSTIHGLHLHYRKLEHRLQAMEAEVTSAQYRFDQELKKGTPPQV